jgi:hypothetical protein
MRETFPDEHFTKDHLHTSSIGSLSRHSQPLNSWISEMFVEEMKSQRNELWEEGSDEKKSKRSGRIMGRMVAEVQGAAGRDLKNETEPE